MADHDDPRTSGKNLLAKMMQFRDNLPENQTDQLAASRTHDLKGQLTKMINDLSHSLETETSPVLLAVKVRDTAIWLLEELMKAGYAQRNGHESLAGREIMGLIQGILFHHLLRGTRLLTSEIQILERELESLRTHIGLPQERRYAFSRADIGKILEVNLELFKPAFSEKNIEAAYKASGNLMAEISKNDIDRLICNLLRNAIEYSYRGDRRFVKVIAREMQPQNEVEISIENFGVPIKQEEIDSGDIFKFGYRGELAYENYRDGLGVGLADAKEVVEAHGGKITITSLPSTNDGPPPQYKVPYLTTVTIRLPKKRN
jgi:signal transduction histidine kinase